MTQISSAQQNTITPQMKEVAKNEGIDTNLLLHRIAQGHIVIPHNPIHAPNSLGIGKGLRVKVNANIGTSREHCNPKEELEKARIAQQTKADAIMDLSTGGDLTTLRTQLLKTISIPFGTVPIYQAGIDAITTYGDVHKETEYEFSTYHFEVANVENLFQHFEDASNECNVCLEAGLPLAAYDQCMVASHAFNVLDARKAISQAQRQNYILKVRELAIGCAKLYKEQEEERNERVRG